MQLSLIRQRLAPYLGKMSQRFLIKLMPITQADLAQFQGTNQYYRHWLKQFVYTDGVKYLAERALSHWLLDAIASYQTDSRVKNDPMLKDIQFWKLQVNSDRSANLILERDTEDEVLRQKIKYTDFPLANVTLYLIEGVLMLKSEY